MAGGGCDGGGGGRGAGAGRGGGGTGRTGWRGEARGCEAIERGRALCQRTAEYDVQRVVRLRAVSVKLVLMLRSTRGGPRLRGVKRGRALWQPPGPPAECDEELVQRRSVEGALER